MIKRVLDWIHFSLGLCLDVFNCPNFHYFQLGEPFNILYLYKVILTCVQRNKLLSHRIEITALSSAESSGKAPNVQVREVQRFALTYRVYEGFPHLRVMTQICIHGWTDIKVVRLNYFLWARYWRLCFSTENRSDCLVKLNNQIVEKSGSVPIATIKKQPIFLIKTVISSVIYG